MKYLTPEQVLAIHDQMIKRFGGSSGVRDVGLMASAVMCPQASYGGKDLYPTIVKKAASLLQSLLKNHPFVDGNKRTALASAGIFLRLNGYKLVNSHDEEVKFALRVDNERLSLETIAAWLKRQSRREKIT